MKPGLAAAAAALLCWLAAAPAQGMDAPGVGAPDPAGLDAGLQGAIRRVAAEAVPSIVQLEVVELIEEYRKSGLGSGVIFRLEGSSAYVVTNNHVLGEAGEITVRLAGGQSYPATLEGRDPRRDLAVVRFQASAPLSAARLGDSSRVQAGDWVLAVGSPLGLNSSVTLGVVSAVGRRGGPGGNISDFIQTDAVINPGNSGGALLNLAGEVIGINTWIASGSGSYEGFGFALPSASVERSVRDILDAGRARYGWLGVSSIDPPPSIREDLVLPAGKGALLANLYLGGPAALAGLELGDFLTQVAGVRIQGTSGLIQAVADASPDSSALVRFSRSGLPMSREVQLAERPEETLLARRNHQLWPGLIALGAEGRQGVEVVQVFRGTPGERSGLRAGDLVTAVNGQDVRGLAGFYALLNRTREGCRLAVRRGEEQIFIELGREVSP